MVHILSRLFVLVTFIAIGLSIPLADVVNAPSDFATVKAAVVKLDKSIIDFPITGGTVSGALAIDANSRSLNIVLKQSITEAINAGRLRDDEARNNIEFLKDLQPVIHDGLVRLISIKAALIALPVNNIRLLVLQDLQNVGNSTTVLLDTLAANFPSGALVVQLGDIRRVITGDYNLAISAYST